MNDYDLTDKELEKKYPTILASVMKLDSICIVKEEDGNYRGFMKKNNKLVQARQSDPGIVLQMLITHE